DIDGNSEQALTVNNAATATDNVWIEFQHEGVSQWELGAHASGTFWLYDVVDNVDRFELSRSGATFRVSDSSDEGLTVRNETGDQFLDVESNDSGGGEIYASLELGEGGGGTFDASEIIFTNDGSQDWSIGGN